MDHWADACSLLEVLRAGHRHTDTNASSDESTENRAPSWKPKPGSHDDGPLAGLFLGGIGTPVCGRNLDGTFSRWHLQSGYHVNQAIDEAFFAVRWAIPDTAHADAGTADPSASGYFRLAAAGLPDGISRRVYSLFPVTSEHYRGGKHDDTPPCEVIAEFFSPLVPDDDAASALPGELPPATMPVWYASITVRNTSDQPIDFDTVCFWPNLLGWRVQQMTTVDRPVRSWPGQTHSGNTAACANLADIDGRVVLQQRHRDRPVHDEMEGEIAICAFGLDGDRSSVETCFKAGDNRIDRPPRRQRHTIRWVEDSFIRSGALPESNVEWIAHWDEALASAVHRGARIGPGESRRFDYVVAFDLPIVRFGDGRRWYRKYTAGFGISGRNVLAIVDSAAKQRDSWRDAISRRHQGELTGPFKPIRGAMLNELYFLNGGGSVWVDRWAHELDRGMPEPLLGPGEHAAILEGYDQGYYYYNTSDLWSYAWYGASRWNRAFTTLVFQDLLQTVPLEIPRRRMIYRSEKLAPLLVRGKLPHDLGSVMEDPWHRINGYQMRDDSNLWKDHNPAFIISLYLQRTHYGIPLTRSEWKIIREAGEFMLAQDTDRDGLPYHDEFGDSTWDNLGIQGRAGYSGSVTIAALAALTVWAQESADTGFARDCRQRLASAQREFVGALWNGEYFRLSDSGKYADCIMGDGIFGFFLADLAGLGELLSGIDRTTLTSHLRAVYRYSFRQYADGRVGPLLVSAPGKTRFSGDGGDELQVNEVLIGSAWVVAAMTHYYGLPEEAHALTTALYTTIYGPDGQGDSLQFRTPAAVDAAGNFRAPMNKRPLAIWFLDLVS